MNPPDLPGLPRGPSGEPVFPEPWAARAFALAVQLNESGAFAWPEFSAALGRARRADPEGDYHAAWLTALETVLAGRGVAEPEALDALTAAWICAAAATPHGRPIVLAASV